MKKNFLAFYLSLLIIICVGLTIFLVSRKKVEETISDAKKFQTEYVELNNKNINDSDKVYPEVNIDENNLYYYASEEEITNLLNSGTGIIYFGFPTCPWCRNIVSILNEIVGNYGYKKIYYYNIKQIRSSYQINANNELEKTNAGTEFYSFLLNKLDNFLTDYNLTDNNGKKILTGEKRLYAPSVLFVKEGKVIGLVAGTVESQKDPFILLDTKQREELTLKYQKYLEEISLTCDEKC